MEKRLAEYKALNQLWMRSHSMEGEQKQVYQKTLLRLERAYNKGSDAFQRFMGNFEVKLPAEANCLEDFIGKRNRLINQK
jgi:hypothetical protein